jgi:hypothetical protein
MVEIDIAKLEALLEMLHDQGVKEFAYDNMSITLGIRPSTSQSIFDQEDN